MYKVARLSTIRMVMDTIKTINPEAQYYDWDAHAEGFKLPSNDLVGLAGFSCTANDRFHDLTFAVGIMVVDDPTLARATDYVDAFYTRLALGKKYPMFNPLDGSLTGFEAVCFDGISASPMSRVDMRPTLDVQVSARVTLAGEWAPS